MKVKIIFGIVVSVLCAAAIILKVKHGEVY